MKDNFIILGLPRSRTAWLSTFLTYDPWTCGHDILKGIYTKTDLRDFFMRPYTGASDTGLIEYLNVLRPLDLKVVIVLRPVQEVEKSLKSLGLPSDSLFLSYLENLLKVESERPGVKTFRYEDLKRQSVCREIFEHCLDLPFDVPWWKELKDLNIQTDIKKDLRSIQGNLKEILKFREEVKRA